MIDDRVAFTRTRNKKTGFSRFWIDGKRVEKEEFWLKTKDHPRVWYSQIDSTRKIVKYYEERHK